MSHVIDPTSRWYQEVSPRDFYNENDLERTIQLNLGSMFPEFRVFPFKQKLYNPITKKNSAADLCLIKADYSEWYVIEVELGKHTFSEVEEQIHTFKNCTYDKSNATYLCNENKRASLNLNKLTNLITSVLPTLMVIVNEDKVSWKKDLTKLGCKMCIFQIYNDFEGKRMYRLNGEYPFIYTDFCNCKYEKQVPFAVKVIKSDFLDGYNIVDGTTFNIDYQGISYLWKREDDGNEVFLICNSNISPLDPLSYRYRLNYNALSIGVIKQGGWFQNIINLFKKNNGLKKINSFTFTKD